MSLKEDFEKCETDWEKWQLLINSEERFKIAIDNDETYLDYKGDWIKFNQSIGSIPGVFELLDAIGIEADYV